MGEQADISSTGERARCQTDGQAGAAAASGCRRSQSWKDSRLHPEQGRKNRFAKALHQNAVEIGEESSLPGAEISTRSRARTTWTMRVGTLSSGEGVERQRSWANQWCFISVWFLLTVTDFGGLDVGIPQAMRRSIDFAANSHGIGAG